MRPESSGVRRPARWPGKREDLEMAASPEEPLTFPRPVPEDFRLTHPEDFAHHGYPHQIWAKLRAEEPVSWQTQIYFRLSNAMRV